MVYKDTAKKRSDVHVAIIFFSISYVGMSICSFVVKLASCSDIKLRE